ncbi:MAG: hypothetical protein B7Z80_05955 [Rhodospirillales bacterium 20-64-7]|nr:MAG: hypothetical protein B7Z80_05955 [Rhodospirillales bacterium 20-64-7]HQT76110.1 gas vesicle protein GvpO [Rhodopila sp.]
MNAHTLTSLVESTKRQMTSITGMEYDTISEFDQAGDGWAVVIDMLEHRSVPRTQDLLSTFEVRLDNAGQVTRWKRTGRCTRGQQG